MGYKSGLGLGKHEQGITNPIDIPINLNHSGLGSLKNDLNKTWDYEVLYPNIC